MNHQEYIKAIDHEQSLIRRLFASRKNRAKKIEKITTERYAHLIGKFFTKENDPNSIYRINEITTKANYIESDQVDVVLCCSCLGTTNTGREGEKIVGLYVHNENITIHPSLNIDEHLAGRFVDKGKALGRFYKLTEQLKNNLNLNEKPEKEVGKISRAAIAFALLSILENEEGEPSTMLGEMDKYDDVMSLMGKVADILNEDDIELLSSLRPNTWNHAIDFQQGADSILGPLPDF
jgi:hypothetical protein